MVTRLQSDKKAFVQSPKKAFDTEAEFEFLAQYTIFIASAVDPRAHWLFNPLLCQRGNGFLATLANGPGEDWTFTILEINNKPWPPSLVTNMVFSQPPSVQTVSVPALLAGTSSCVEGGGIWTNYWAGPSEPGVVGGTDAWEKQFSIVDDTFSPDRNQWRMYKHPGSTLPQAYFPTDWTPGNVDVALV